MKKVLISGWLLLTAIAAHAGTSVNASVNADTILSSSAYAWVADSIVQGEFRAYAASSTEIVSNYAARPHYFVPVAKRWNKRNNLDAYPRLLTDNKLLQAVYNMGLDEMVNAVEPDTTLRTGKEWAGVWTRGVSYSIILSVAALQPQASMISLRKKVDSVGRIIQDTGSGGAWPVSTDREVWILAAWELYKVTADRDWLAFAYGTGVRSITQDMQSIYSPQGLVRGETSFIDWREQSHPRWMQTADIYNAEAMNTNVVHAAALHSLAEMARILGRKNDGELWQRYSDELKSKINDTFFMPDKGYYAVYRYGRNHLILNPREETLGEALAILYDIASPQQAVQITESVPVTPYGPAIFYPQIADMPSYHNNALWPFVAAYWTLANAKAGNEAGLLQGFGSIIRPAALFATNKENFNLDNGDIFTELNSSNMLWSLSGNLALTHRILFGIEFKTDGLLISPIVPQAMKGERKLENFPYRGARLNICVSGSGTQVKTLTVNGKKLDPTKVIPAKLLLKGADITVVMADNPFATNRINAASNLKAPLTPQTWIETDAATAEPVLRWNPIEYIACYKVLHNGKEKGVTRSTQWVPDAMGEWQVIGVSSDGTPGFASEPRRFGSETAVQIPGENHIMTSEEITYRPETSPEGCHGGFVETDHKNSTVTIPVEVKAAGEYAITVRYANGNGPVNTENKCAIRSMLLNGQKIGTVVMPQRGVANWNDWGLSNPVIATLPAGISTITLQLTPADENMNIHTNHALIDELLLTPMP